MVQATYCGRPPGLLEVSESDFNEPSTRRRTRTQVRSAESKMRTIKEVGNSRRCEAREPPCIWAYGAARREGRKSVFSEQKKMKKMVRLKEVQRTGIRMVTTLRLLRCASLRSEDCVFKPAAPLCAENVTEDLIEESNE
jgi:hypothetical protein